MASPEVKQAIKSKVAGIQKDLQQEYKRRMKLEGDLN